MNFIYLDNYFKYQDILDKQIKDFKCKHVLRTNTLKSKKLLKESEKIGYYGAMWGQYMNIHTNTETNRTIQIQTIQKMIYDNYNKPFRIIIDETGEHWIDNLHSAIRDILVFGSDTKVKDVNAYIIDTRTDPISIININNSVSNNVEDIKKAIAKACNRQKRLSDNIRRVNYTIEDFMLENDINLEALTISKENLFNYRK